MSDFVIYLMAVFMAIGAIDRILGNPLGLGAEFANGIQTFGALALSMLGIIALAPVLANVLRPVVVPVFRLFGADPGMFPGSILACDMGGAALAMELAESREAGLFGGTIIGGTAEGGSGIYVDSGAFFGMAGGTVSGGASNKGCISSYGTMELSSGTVEGDVYQNGAKKL